MHSDFRFSTLDSGTIPFDVDPNNQVAHIPIPLPTAIPLNPLQEIENFDIYEPNQDGETNNSSQKSSKGNNSYPTDAKGFITVPMINDNGYYDVITICNAIKEKIDQDPKTWTEKLPNGLVLHLVSKRDRSKSKDLIPYIPYYIAIEFFIAFIIHKTRISFIGNPRFLEATEPEHISEYLEIYSWTTTVLKKMQSFDLTIHQLLLRHSKVAQAQLFCVILHAMVKSFFFNYERRILMFI